MMNLESKELNAQDFSHGSKISSDLSKDLENIHEPNSRFSSVAVKDSCEVYKTSPSKHSKSKKYNSNEILVSRLSQTDQGLLDSQYRASGNLSKKSLTRATSVNFIDSEEYILDNFQLLKPKGYPTIQHSSNSKNSPPNTGKPETLSNMSVLEKIPELDENLQDETPGYFGWDGYEARFKESLQDKESTTSIPVCIPPWAKSLKKAYGILSSESNKESEESQQTMREKIENLMKKHKELMLVKRVESKKQVIVEPSTHPDELDTVKMRAKSTRFYVAPLTKNGTSKSRLELPDIHKESSRVSIPELSDSEISLAKKTSKTKAKREVSSVLKNLQKTYSKTQYVEDNHFKDKKDLGKCPKITLSDVREFVNMTPDERKLHQIIKIEKVPSSKIVLGTDIRDKKKLGESQYIINIPKSETTDRPTLDVIKIKEKRKLRVESIENIEERVTELRYNQGTSRKHPKERRNDFSSKNKLCDYDLDRNIQNKLKSPTETKTFQVMSKKTPIIRSLIDQEDKTDKVLLIQYDKKSKRGLTDGKTTDTQILGIKKISKQKDEMYLYDSGPDKKETASKVEDIPPTLKEKVNMIFEEIRQLTFKPEAQVEISASEVQVCPSVSSKTTQRPSRPVATHVAMTQAVPEVKSAQVQVHQSELLSLESTKTAESLQKVPYSTPENRAGTVKSTVDDKELKNILTHLDSEKTYTDEYIKDEGEIKRSESSISIKDEEDFTKQILQDISSEELKEANKMNEDKLSKDQEILKGAISESSIDFKSEVIDEDNLKKSLSLKQSLKSEEAVQEHEILDKEGIEMVLKTSKEKEILPKDFHETEVDNRLLPVQSKIPSVESMKTSEQFLDGDKKRVLPTEEEEKNINIDTEKMKRTSNLSKVSFAINKDEDDTCLKIQEIKGDDIRSYEFLPEQGKELKIKLSSKFFSDKEGIRKKMNWTDDTIYLENNVGPQLIHGLAEVALRQPADPITYLANWLYKDYENREHEESQDVFTEHLELARTMIEVENTGAGDAQAQKKFNLKRYPMTIKSADVLVNQSIVNDPEESLPPEEKLNKNYFRGYPENDDLGPSQNQMEKV